MKKLLFVSYLVLSSLFVLSQSTIPQGGQCLPNQFRDFVDHQIKWENFQIERRGGKVIITMTEDYFVMMQSQGMRHVNIKQDPPCGRCIKKHRYRKQLRKRPRGYDMDFGW